jgi:hydrogenase expression/formation protein HypC
MCLGIPGCVVEFVDESHHLAKVDVAGVRRTVNVALVLPDGLQPGDWVLIHVGFALSRIDEAEAQRTNEFLRALGDPWQQELDDLSRSEIE